MKLEIIRRRFAKIDDRWVELEDLNNRGLTAERAWSSFCAFFRAGDPDALAATMRKHVTPPHIDIVVSHTDGSVWVLGAYYYLESALPRLALLSADRETAEGRKASVSQSYAICFTSGARTLALVTPEAELSFSKFYSWVEQKHSNYLAFRTTTSVRYDIEMWFDQEFNQTGRR